MYGVDSISSNGLEMMDTSGSDGLAASLWTISCCLTSCLLILLLNYDTDEPDNCFHLNTKSSDELSKEKLAWLVSPGSAQASTSLHHHHQVKSDAHTCTNNDK